ncbi:HIT-like domain containing protein [Tylopilus felleus]
MVRSDRTSVAVGTTPQTCLLLLIAITPSPLLSSFPTLIMAAPRYLATCIFCKIVKGEIPSFKLVETGLSYAFLDINPLSKGHALVIPKDHAIKMHELPDEYLADALPIAKKIALAQGLDNYNFLQNNGRLAHQEVDHVHFHVIPKPNETEGVVFTPQSWPTQKPSMDDLKEYHTEFLKKLDALGKL